MAIAVLVVLLPLAGHALWDYIQIRRLVKEIDAIRGKGEPVTMAEAGLGYRQLSTEEELAARHFMAAAVLAQPAMKGQWGALAPLHEYLAGHPPDGLDLAVLADRLQQILVDGRTALELSDVASLLPFDGFVPGTSYNYRAAELMSLVRLQSVRTARYALAGTSDDAVQSARASLRSRPLLRELPAWTMASFDVALILSCSSPSTDELRRLLNDLQEWDSRQDIEKSVLADRAVFIDRVFREVYGGDPGLPHSYGTRFRSAMQAAGRPWFTRRFVRAIRGSNDLVSASTAPWSRKWAEMRTVYSRFDEGDVLFRLLPRRSFEGLAVDRSSLAATAVAIYARENGGEMPASLQGLVGKYLPAVPIDPGNGQPLKFKVDAAAFTVYSVGADGVDDGGDLVSELREVDERGWGRRQLRGKDVGVRVLLNARNPGSTEE